MAHRPIHSVKVAIQLGIIAPAAINAMIALSNDGNNQATSWNLPDGLLISSAQAAQSPTLAPRPSSLECIIKALIKKPC